LTKSAVVIEYHSQVSRFFYRAFVEIPLRYVHLWWSYNPYSKDIPVD